MEDIPNDLVINWDQTSMKIVPSSSWTMEKCGTKHVEIAAADDKQQITALFTCTATGQFIPIQLIYERSTAGVFLVMSSFRRVGISHVPQTIS